LLEAYGIVVVVALSTEAVLMLNYLFWMSAGAFRSRRGAEQHNLLATLVVIVSCAYMLVVLYFHYYIRVGVGLV
jgi:hypothetical protein